MNRVVVSCVLAALAPAGCASTSSAGAPSASGAIVRGAAASCVGLTPSQQIAAAKLVFDATALPGATVPGSDGILASPARFRVQRYVKGHGRSVVTVQTATRVLSGGSISVSEDGIQPRAGERWQIDAGTRTEPYATSICLGSRRR